MINALLGTMNGVYRLQDDEVTFMGMDGHHVSAIHAFSGENGNTAILAGTYGDGLFRSEDDGQNWNQVSNGLTATAFRTIIPDPSDGGATLCGAEPGRIFQSVDGGQEWEEFTGIPALEGSKEWFLPYSPRAGAVRNIYSPPGSDRILGAVEVGGLLDSPDRGATWSCRPILGDTDIHFITGHPEDPNLLYAALGWASLKSIKRAADDPQLGGVAQSRDGGKTWTKFHSDYTRAVIVPPGRPDLLLAGPAERVGERGRIEVSTDGGDTWKPADHGIDSPTEDMVEVFLSAPGGSIWAIRSGGGLIRAIPGEWQWQSVLPKGTEIKVRSVTFVAG